MTNMQDCRQQPLYSTIFETLSKSARTDLTVFLNKHKDANDCFLISDYCIGDKDKYNDVYSFVILPYVVNCRQYISTIKDLLPQDYKKTSILTDKNKKALLTMPYLATNFIIPAKFRNILKCRNDKEEFKKIILQNIEMFNLWIQNNPKNEKLYKEHIQKHKQLLQKSQRNDFNIRLYIRSFFTASLAADLTHEIEKYSKVTRIFWGTDRDDMLSSNNEILLDNYLIQYNGFARNDKDWTYNSNFIPGIMHPDTGTNNWYDELIRLPDFCAGALASVNFIDDNEKIAHISAPTEKQQDKYYNVLDCIKQNSINIIIKKESRENKAEIFYAWRLEYVISKH